MKYVNRTVQGITLKVPMRDATTPIFVVAIYNALNEGLSPAEATRRAWAASKHEVQIARTANGGNRVIVVGMADGEIKGTYVVGNAWIEPGVIGYNGKKERDRLMFEWESELLNKFAITIVNEDAKAPRRAIALCK